MLDGLDLDVPPGADGRRSVSLRELVVPFRVMREAAGSSLYPRQAGHPLQCQYQLHTDVTAHHGNHTPQHRLVHSDLVLDHGFCCIYSLSIQ